MRGSEFTVHGPSLSMQIHYYYLVVCNVRQSRIAKVTNVATCNEIIYLIDNFSTLLSA